MDLYNAGIRSLDDLRRTGKHEQVLKYHDDINLPFVLLLACYRLRSRTSASE